MSRALRLAGPCRRPPTPLLCLLLAAGAVPASSQLTVERTIMVGATGTPSQNCEALRSALEGIPAPRDLSNAYLVKLGPGEYGCGNISVSIPSFVAVEGAGQHVTTISGTRNDPVFGVVDFSSTRNAELRSVTVANWTSEGQSSAIGISVYNGAAYLRDVEVRRFGPGAANETALWLAKVNANARLEVWTSDLHFSTSVRTESFGSGGTNVVGLFMSRILGSFDNRSGSIRCYGSVSGDTTSYTTLTWDCQPSP